MPETDFFPEDKSAKFWFYNINNKIYYWKMRITSESFYPLEGYHTHPDLPSIGEATILLAHRWVRTVNVFGIHLRSRQNTDKQNILVKYKLYIWTDQKSELTVSTNVAIEEWFSTTQMDPI